MKKPIPCLAQSCKIICQSLQSAELCWKPYLRKAKQFPVISENILTRLFQILSVNIFFFVGNTRKNHNYTGRLLEQTILSQVCKQTYPDLRVYKEIKASTRNYLKYLTLLRLTNNSW